MTISSSCNGTSSAGLYFEHQTPQPALDVPPFWQERGSGSPSCQSDGVCCSGDNINGTWHETDAAQVRKLWLWGGLHNDMLLDLKHLRR